MLYIESEETKYIQKEKREQLIKLLDCLNPREEYIIRSRYGIDMQIKTFKVLSEVFGVSRNRVHQMSIRALRKLRKEAGV